MIENKKYLLECSAGVLHFSYVEPPVEKGEYAFYVLRDGAIYHREGYGPFRNFHFQLTENGRYAITYFVRKDGKIEQSISEAVDYCPQRALLLGPAVLERTAGLCDIMAATQVEEASYIIIDVLEIAQKETYKIFRLNKNEPQKRQVEKLRHTMMQRLAQLPELPIYLIRWELWPTEERFRNLHWVLEELYDCCRRSRVVTEQSVCIDKVSHDLICEDFYDIFHDRLKDVFCNIYNKVLYCDIEEMYIENELKDSHLHASIVSTGMKIDDRYCFYLIRDGKVIDRTGWLETCNMHWDLFESGVYLVQGYIKRGNMKIFRKSPPRVYLTQAHRDLYCAFMQGEGPKAPQYLAKPLVCPPLQDPLCNILICTGKGAEKHELVKLPRVDTVKTGNEITTIYANAEPIAYNGNKLLLSGTISTKERSYRGMQDLIQDPLLDVTEQIGDYAYLIWSPRRMEVGTDFFAFKHWFYYRNEKQMLISNNYVTLLMALANLGIRLRLDVDKACITLSSVQVQLLSQNFSARMDMKGAFQLTGYQRLVYENGKWSIVSSPAGRILEKEPVYHEQTYRKMLEDGKNEIVENIRSIFSDKYQDILVDLSGGLDSRVIFAALSCIENKPNNIRLNCRDVGDDLRIAMMLNGIYGFPYMDLSEQYDYLPLTEADYLNRSYYMGLYYSKGLLGAKKPGTSRINVIGACGEILARPYISRKYFYTRAAQTDDPKKFMDILFEDLSALFVLDGKEIQQSFIEYFSDELLKMPAKSLFESLDRQYLTFRHGYHFEDTVKGTLREVYGMPLQSRKLFALHHMSYDVHKSIRMELDLITALNPMLAAVPFESKQDNEDCVALREALVKPQDARFKNISLNLKSDMALWEEAEARRKKTLVNKGAIKEYIDLDEQIYEALLYAFFRLMKAEPKLESRIGVALYYQFLQIKEIKRNVKYWYYWYNKVISLMDQIDLFAIDDNLVD